MAAQTAREHGLRVDVMPEAAGVPELVDALAEHVADLRAKASCHLLGRGGVGGRKPPAKRRRATKRNHRTELSQGWRSIGNMSDAQNASHTVPLPVRRPRRLRTSPVMRNFTAETELNPNRFVLPAFIADGIDEPKPISSLPGVVQHTTDSLLKAVEEAANAGVGSIDLFGVPLESDKDATGSVGAREDGVLNRALTAVRERFGDDILVMADTCLDEFTDHGHCGVLSPDSRGDLVVDNDATLQAYADMAVAQANAGAHIVSPSGMMDGQVRVIREALDAAGHQDVAIMAYSAKYASAFYGSSVKPWDRL